MKKIVGITKRNPRIPGLRIGKLSLHFVPLIEQGTKKERRAP